MFYFQSLQVLDGWLWGQPLWKKSPPKESPSVSPLVARPPAASPSRTRRIKQFRVATSQSLGMVENVLLAYQPGNTPSRGLSGGTCGRLWSG